MGALFYVIDEYIEQVNTVHCKLYKKLSHKPQFFITKLCS